VNRAEFKDWAKSKLQFIESQNEEKLKTGERLRKSFISAFKPHTLSGLSLDKFASGLGKESGSFCYRLEWELESLGRIQGSSVSKFGVWFSKDEQKYRHTKKWGRNVPEAFEALKSALADLLDAARANDLPRIAENPISPMFKGKILHVYHPDDFMPVYSLDHLAHFTESLIIPVQAGDYVAMHKAILEYRLHLPFLKDISSGLWADVLYAAFDYPVSKSDISEPAAPDLQTLLGQASFTDTMPPVPKSSAAGARKGGRGKIDYEAQGKRNKWLGDRGELIVMDMEKKRLTKAGCQDLAKGIVHVASTDDAAGYDILSFETNGQERPIEVKATVAKDLRNGFYLTQKELETAESTDNYHLYIVFSADGSTGKPLVHPVHRELLLGDAFCMTPTQFRVMLGCHTG